MLLQWDKDPQEMNYNPLILTFADGLRETQHPYIFIARTGLKELLEVEGATEKLATDSNLSNQLCNTIRLALMDPSKDVDIFNCALDATEQLSNCLGPYLNATMIDKLLIQISRKSFDKKYNQKIMKVLASIDQNCGDNKEILSLIRKKVPTYQGRI
jgi:hypothetical protein